jgi:uncharacterized protein YbgA (DUF1722 family)/uncharacterized protein YbbK (DUF523 family)
MEKIKVGISSCILGEKVRYDGGHKLDRYIRDTLGQYFTWVPVCPEVECGLPIPRESMRLVGDPEAPRLMTRKTKIDQTERMQKWASKRLKELEKEDLCGFIFKCRSPSSGISGVKVYSESGMPGARAAGIFGGAYIKRSPLIPVEDDGRMHDANLRENFIERVFVFYRWKELCKKGKSIKNLVDFHTNHKLLILSHSPKHFPILGRLVANAKKYKTEDLFREYLEILTEGLCLIATVKKNTNVLNHIMGYFKKKIESSEKKELIDVIENYHKRLVPLIVPITLLNHYVNKFDEKYLKRQIYLNPHPLEMMLRNHV